MTSYCPDLYCFSHLPCPEHEDITKAAGAIVFDRPATTSSTLGGEKSLFEDRFSGSLQAGWHWVREDKAAWRFSDCALLIRAQPGGIWSDCFKGKLAANFLLRAVPDKCTACEVTVKLTPGSYGEQGGLFWMIDENTYIKLVVEGMKDGSSAVVLVREVNGEAAVVSKAPFDAANSASLRLEISPCGQKISGLLDTGYCMRLIGSCEAKELLSGCHMIGVGAHGGTAEGCSWAEFSAFRCLQIASNRVQFGSTARPDVSLEDNEGDEEEILYAPEVPQPGGWVFSSALSDEERAKIQGMLSAQGLPTA